MNVGRIVKVTLAAGIAYNIIDYIAINFLLGGVFASMQSIMNPTPSMTANAIVNFGAGLILAIAYDKVGTTFGAGPMGGLIFGLYAGLLANVPIWIALHVWLKDISYGNAWIMTVYGVVAYALMGATAGFAATLGEQKAG
ncbi:MAG: hypothetical protein FJ206_06130 [Gemmatimonadetes bacterium]|nr:hypothetical protein [Gemmatimonadota bacterium]